MATLYIQELSTIGTSPNNQSLQVSLQPPITEQTVAIGGSSTQSSAFNTKTRFVRIHTDAICSILFGSNPTATAAKARMNAGDTEYFAVPQDQSFKVAVITNS